MRRIVIAMMTLLVPGIAGAVCPDLTGGVEPGQTAVIDTAETQIFIWGRVNLTVDGRSVMTPSSQPGEHRLSEGDFCGHIRLVPFRNGVPEVLAEDSPPGALVLILAMLMDPDFDYSGTYPAFHAEMTARNLINRLNAQPINVHGLVSDDPMNPTRPEVAAAFRIQADCPRNSAILTGSTINIPACGFSD